MRTLKITALIATAAVIALATPASATWTYPSTAKLTDAAGKVSHCTASTAVSGTDGRHVTIYASLTCTADSLWRETMVAIKLRTVGADGHRGSSIGYIDLGTITTATPKRVDRAYVRTINVCTRLGLPSGSQPVIVGATVRANKAHFDGHRYAAIVENLATLTC